MRDFSISDFRLLVWTTTLVYTARCNHHEDPRQIKALCNLKKFRNWCGENVVNALDGLCRPQSIKKLNIQQLKLLFLVVIGVCLSATYTLVWSPIPNRYSRVHFSFHHKYSQCQRPRGAPSNLLLPKLRPPTSSAALSFELFHILQHT